MDPRVADAGVAEAGSVDAGLVDGGAIDFSACELVDGGDATCTTPVYSEYCRVEVLRRRHAEGCVTDADCVRVPYTSNCIAWGLCAPEPAVLATSLNDFEAARDAELAGFCASAPCFFAGSCAAGDTRVVCRQGRCESDAI
ncbi:MAG: hypothetical protein ACO1OB_10965 [Archangium sp.]